MGRYLSIYIVSHSLFASLLQAGEWPISCLDFVMNVDGFLYLDGEGGQFSWLRRMKIAIGIAQGLRYLHTELQPPFAISELNSNSVYVTEDFTPKVCPAHASLFVGSATEDLHDVFGSSYIYHGLTVPSLVRQ